MMKYSDLIQFEPIDEVIELRQADKVDVARNLVSTFVVSDRLAEQLTEVLFPEIQFEDVGQNLGILIVGNYGTGKSHLMAFLSAIAEHEDMVEEVGHAEVRGKAAKVAGQFEVSRLEIGAVTMSLRDIICQHLEETLAARGISFEFKPASEIRNNKGEMERMMGVFHEKYPDKGMFLVVDELLDYLRGRNDQQVAMDFGFLRELGEICKTTRFRFMAGIQESLFDNPRFQFVQDSVRRVKERYRQFRITKEDVAFVVEKRLLRKTADQEAVIREHLRVFAPLYSAMNERLDDFVRLFPVHPAYFDAFEQVAIAEKREVLKTLSREIRELLDHELPETDTGLIGYDTYWKTLRGDPVFRAVPEIREVLDRSEVLESRIINSFPTPKYKPVALRIIHGLSVHRLTTGDIFRPLGPTAEELRDNLCLHLPVPEEDPGFLRTLVEKVLKDIITTVNGQYITFNPENGQYYLDLKKDIDFDAIIDQRASTLSDEELDRYYFEALRQVILEQPDAAPYVSGYRIWEHDLEWRSHKAARPGYLFFGAPNERSTAQPPRDFYIYFAQPFAPPKFTDEQKSDEVFFFLKRRDEVFEQALKRYSASKLLGMTSAGENKSIFAEKAQHHLRSLTAWLRQNMATAYEVVHSGDRLLLAERTKGKVTSAEAESVRDLANACASLCLEAYFAETAPQYPVFQALLTRANREQAVSEALRAIATGSKSKQGLQVLDALGLLDGDQITPAESPYAQDILVRLRSKPKDQVLNRSEILESVAPGVEYWAPDTFRLEPELLAVVLASLVRSGDIVLSVLGTKLDASSTDQLAKLGVKELRIFKHVERPRDLPMEELKKLFKILDLNEALLVQPTTRDHAAKELVTRSIKLVEELLSVRELIKPGIPFWGKPILSDTERDRWVGELDTLKAFLEGLQPFNTGGKLKNFRLSLKELDGPEAALKRLAEGGELHVLTQKLQSPVAYAMAAENVLPQVTPWLAEARKTREAAVSLLSDPEMRRSPRRQKELSTSLDTLLAGYRKEYQTQHVRARLNAAADKRKGALAADNRLKQLRQLASVEGMPAHSLKTFQDELLGLNTCFMLAEPDLEASVICPHCRFRPSEEGVPAGSAAGSLERLEGRLDRLYDDWRKTLLRELEDPTVKESLKLMAGTPGGEAIRVFQESRELPDPVDTLFVQALNEALSGLEGVPVSKGDMEAALLKGGARCTPDQLRQRLDEFIQEKTKGKAAVKVRLVIE